MWEGAGAARDQKLRRSAKKHGNVATEAEYRLEYRRSTRRYTDIVKELHMLDGSQMKASDVSKELIIIINGRGLKWNDWVVTFGYSRPRPDFSWRS